MKKIFLFLIAILFLTTGCTGTALIKYENSICINRPVQFAESKSWICEVSAKAGIAPEEIDNFLLDSTAILYITDALTIDRMKQLITDVREEIGTNCSGLTYTEFLDFIFKDAAKLDMSLRILNRRLGMYYSNSPISDFDCFLITSAIDHQAEQFGI